MQHPLLEPRLKFEVDTSYGSASIIQKIVKNGPTFYPTNLTLLIAQRWFIV